VIEKNYAFSTKLGTLKIHGVMDDHVADCHDAASNPTQNDLDIDWTKMYKREGTKLAILIEYTMHEDILVQKQHSRIYWDIETDDVVLAEFGDIIEVETALGKVPVSKSIYPVKSGGYSVFHVYYSINSMEQTVFRNLKLVQSSTESTCQNKMELSRPSIEI